MQLPDVESTTGLAGGVGVGAPYSPAAARAGKHCGCRLLTVISSVSLRAAEPGSHWALDLLGLCHVRRSSTAGHASESMPVQSKMELLKIAQEGVLTMSTPLRL